MNTPDGKQPSELSYLPEGAFAARLEKLQEPKPAPTCDPYRAAAAVLSAFDPLTLVPAELGEIVAKPHGGASLLPYLMPAASLGVVDKSFPWTLNPAERKETLARLRTRVALRAALDANPKRPDDRLQNLLVGIIEGQPPDTTQLNSRDLADLGTVSLWLEGTELASDLPSPAETRRLLESRREADNLRHLIGDAFIGREHESALIREYLEADDNSIYWVNATGGTGKSALIAQTLLNWNSPPSPSDELPKRSWIRLDLDHSRFQPDHPLSLLAEISRQLRRKHPNESVFVDIAENTAAALAEEGQSGSAMESMSGGPSQAISRLLEAFRQAISLLLGNGRRFVIWIDTFEEAQFLGSDVVADQLGRLAELRVGFPALRLIISGRTPPPAEDPRLRHLVFRTLKLNDLPQSAAMAVLERHWSNLRPGTSVEPAKLENAAGVLGGNPLTLRLAARILAEESGTDPFVNLRGVRQESLQRQLYSRVLEHIHDPEVHALAVPGLIVRRVTPGVILEVLAEPCGLKCDTIEQAIDLFERFSAEITIVDPEPPDALVHRHDLRMLMLAAMPEELGETISAIDTAAVRYWGNLAGKVARAEEIYHRMRLGESPAIIEARWSEDAAPSLLSALEEFPAESPVGAWLVARLGGGPQLIHSPAAATEGLQLPLPLWERQASVEATRLIRERRYEEALALLRQRPERSLDSPLFALESRVLLFLGDAEKAKLRALHGIDIHRRIFETANWRDSSALVDLSLFAALIDERAGRTAEALERIDSALGFASEDSDPLPLLSALLRRARLRRIHGETNRADDAETARLAQEIGSRRLAANPALLRELAAELGIYEPEFMFWAANSLLEELIRDTPVSRVVEALEISTGRSFDHLLHASSDELVKHARHTFEEQLHSKSSLGLAAGKILCQLFRENVDHTLSRDFTLASESLEMPPSPTLSGDRKFLALLTRILGILPPTAIDQIARFGARQNSVSSLPTGRPEDIARILTERADTLRLVPQLLHQLNYFARLKLPLDDLTELKRYQQQLGTEMEEPPGR